MFTVQKCVVICLMVLCLSVCADEARKINVLVWDERQPTQKQAYDGGFLGDTISKSLAKNSRLNVTSRGFTDPEQGLGDDIINKVDVIIWWGHAKQRDIKWSVGDVIVDRMKQNKTALIALHSAHWSTPFIRAMNEKTVELATASLTEAERKEYKIVTVLPKAYTGVKKETKLTPYWTKKTDESGAKILEVTLPICVFPSWEHNNKPSNLTTRLKDHPIAKGIPEKWTISKTEMYDEPFHVPAPDELIFEEDFSKGEHFRSGMIWNVGKGKVFYFRPGHETCPVYKEELPLKVVENAVIYLGENVIGTK